jgi:hypothetical protein
MFITMIETPNFAEEDHGLKAVVLFQFSMKYQKEQERFASILKLSLWIYFMLTGIGVITTSIRRLIARPSSVLLDAKGRPDP